MSLLLTDACRSGICTLCPDPAPSRQVGRRRLFSVKAVEEWLASSEREAS